MDINVSSKLMNNDLKDILIGCRKQVGLRLDKSVTEVTIEDIINYLNEFSSDSFIDINSIWEV